MNLKNRLFKDILSLFICIISIKFTNSLDNSTCMNIDNCPEALKLIEQDKYGLDTINILKQSHCGNDGRQEWINCGMVTSKVKDKWCVTPNGFKGKCVKLEECSTISLQFGKQDPIYKEFIGRSNCGSNMVCCGNDTGFDNRCGIFDSARYLSFDGTPVFVNEHPWVVILKYLGDTTGQEAICGGTLINSQFVVTAAHCARKRDMKNVRVGAFRNNDLITDNIDVKILGMRVHEKYNATEGRFDIALLKIQQVPYQENIRWICLPSKDMLLPTNFVAVGFGVNDKGYAGRSELETKLKIEIPHVPTSVCRTFYPNVTTVDYDHVICAGGIPGRDVCRGDSGGPLANKTATDRWYLYGIVSHGNYDCSIGQPGIYMKVTEFLDWINQKMLDML